MNHFGADVLDELESSEWERCPDWNGRPVVRFSHNQVPWILWQGSDRFLDGVSSRQHLGERGCYRVMLEEASLAPNEIYFFLDCSENPTAVGWLGVKLQTLQSVDQLVHRFGRPPQEVQCDWLSQRLRSWSEESSPDFLSHFLATQDGRLLSLSSVEAIVVEHLSNNTASPTFDLGITIPNERNLRDAPRAPTTASGSLEELLRDELAAIELFRRPLASKKPWLIPDGELDQKSSFPVDVLAKSTFDGLRPNDQPFRRHRNPKSFYSYLGAGAALLVAIVGFGVWTSRPSLQVVQLDPGAPPTNESKSEGASFGVAEIEQQEPLAQLELSGDLQSLPESVLEGQASSSLESLMGQIMGGKPPASIDSISFESVTEALNQTSHEAIVQESLTEAGLENPFDLSKATNPFSESLDEAATQALMQEEVDSATNASKEPAENPIASDFVSQSLTIRQAQYRTKILVPFRPNDRQAICRVKLDVADNLLMKPVETAELVGRQDMVWSIAFNDDSIHLNVYLRSIPARSWYIATAVRLKLGNSTEIPISKNEATQVCLRLQNYLRWLDQSRQVGELMRGNKKTRSMAISGLTQIEKQTKSTEKSLKNWLAIERLVVAFYEENSIELELASSSGMLPLR